MPVYLFVVLFLHSRDELNFIKEAVLLDEKDYGLVVSFTFIHSYVCSLGKAPNFFASSHL